ncbi:conjugal transfer protein TrbG [Notoacmeibacter ruber]|uniref:Conjugal transfer protein TrbG n=2 Tax=Notoacmeibacter ruber TaxID=2670375 RepID=A0A3L7J3C6_9HYPH|nr:conjugal transfer protein TrbG [Notoacmeibacter ruber]
MAAVSLGLTLCAFSAHAEYNPRKGPYDARVRNATYRDGEVYRVRVSLTHVTTIEFGKGETIRSIVAGDTEGFQLDGVPGGRAFAIKPAAVGVSTNITVYTNQRSYYFSVTEAEAPTHYVIRFTYPETKKADDKHAIAKLSPNYAYGSSGDVEITPAAIWDDGTFTYFQFAPNAPVPAIFRWSKGNERSVNAMATENDVIRVSGINDRWVLRLGDQEVCIQGGVIQ